jgi:hypothetical protein
MFAGGQDSVKAGQAAAAERLATKREKDRARAAAAAAKAAAKAAADALKLKKANTLFDMDQIQIIAALKGEVSKEDETRLKLQFAILTGNVSEASKLAGEVAKAQGLTKALVDYYSGIPDANNPFAPWIKTLTDAEAIAKRIAALSKSTPQGGTGGGAGGGSGIDNTATNLFQSIVDQGLARGESQATIGSTLRYTAMGQQAMGQSPVVNVTVQGSLVAQADLDKVITDAVTRANSSGTLSKFDRIPIG